MKQVNLATVDLNLLKTFLAIWETRSLTVAGDLLHLSQPAVSHALRRLRDVFDDPLFVRGGVGMAPTTTAVALHPPIDHAMTIIRGALQRHGQFHAASADRVFRLAMSDLAATHVMPALVADLAQCAPSVRLETRSLPVDELDMALRNGDVELAVGYLPGLSEGCVGEHLLTDEFVCLISEKHPLADAELTIESLNRISFINIETNVTGHGLAERALRAAGVHRQIAVTVPHFTVAPSIVSTTQFGLIVPGTVARNLASVGALRVKAIPCPMPPLHVKAYSHVRFRSDPGIVWLRQKFMDMFCDDQLGSVLQEQIARPRREAALMAE